MKFKVKDNVTVEGTPVTTSIEEFVEQMKSGMYSTSFETFMKDEEIELQVNNINKHGLSFDSYFTFDAFYTRSNGEKIYLFDLGCNEFERVE